ncbi:cation diffusion facilitator family transporter [Bacteroides pyogenes]|uniref:cation diffusion facilitator family transporter n=1 Tax=Bacteroides pyogenes TaxID=310300 RepID=UPI003B4308F5
MDSHHHHHHEHNHRLTSLNKAFVAGIVLNLSFVIIEFGAGFYYHSLGLLSDAGHNLGDVASLVLAMLAFRLEKVRPNSRYTYGYRKSTVLVSLLNAVILLVAVGVIIAESVEKLIHPAPVAGSAIVWTAGAGVVINALTAWLFMKDKDKDLNVKGAYLHMAADTLVSVGVVVSGFIIMYTGWYIVDPVIGLLIAVVIIVSTWGLLHDSLRLSLDGVPVGIDSGKVKQTILETPGVADCHHLHIWALSTTETALTVHVVIDDVRRMEEVKHRLKHRLEEEGIHHVTLEVECKGCLCDSADTCL